MSNGANPLSSMPWSGNHSSISSSRACSALASARPPSADARERRRSIDSSVRSARASTSSATRLRTSGSRARASLTPNSRLSPTAMMVVVPAPIRSAVGRRPLHELAEEELLTKPVHQLQVGLEVVDMLLLVGEDALEEVSGGDVPLLPTHRDTGTQPRKDFLLDSQISLELLPYGLPYPQRQQLLVVRQTLQEQDAVGDPLRMLHLLDGLRPGVLGELGESPVGLHLGVQEVLIDGGQLTGQLFVEQRQDLVIAAHNAKPP